MIRITVNAGKDVQARVSELYDAVREETRVWSMSDLRRTKNLKLMHKARNVKGIIRRVKSPAGADPALWRSARREAPWAGGTARL
jgi:hypothetical protein